MAILKEPISQHIWDMKYRYRQGDQVMDSSIEATWQRVAKAIAQAEKPAERSHWEAVFSHLLEDFRFLPGGRILAGAGTQHQVTLLNCFVMNIAEDSLTGIFKALGEGALTLQQGGGIGYDFSVLRPQGDGVAKVGVPASGPVSFMRIWDSMCGVMLSTGARRGAMMGVLRCDHPDIEKFIYAKHDPHELRHFNLSVMISDAFMNAVKKDEKWPLIFPLPPGEKPKGEIVERQWDDKASFVPCRVYKRVRARTLWESIMRSAYDTAEPGVLFSDRINRLNNLSYREQIQATNPCGEIPLPSYGACNLGAINLTQFVQAPFSPAAQMKWAEMEEAVQVATRFLDDVLQVSHYPLESQHQQALGSRRIGLGVTGLADAFIMLGLSYGSSSSLLLAEEIMKRIRDVTWHTSVALAREKGIFPFYTKDYLQGAFVQTLDASLRQALAQYGLRNSHHNAIAPTGTISLLANNVSNGIEPVYCAIYKRHVQSAEGSPLSFEVKDYAYQQWQTLGRHLPEAWKDAQCLLPDAHLQMQAAMQAYVDNAISKTINIPAHFPFEKLADVYTEAYALGLKGCTVFRPNPIRGNVLEVDEALLCCKEE